jgi:hypothetical protein
LGLIFFTDITSTAICLVYATSGELVSTWSFSVPKPGRDWWMAVYNEKEYKKLIWIVGWNQEWKETNIQTWEQLIIEGKEEGQVKILGTLFKSPGANITFGYNLGNDFLVVKHKTTFSILPLKELIVHLLLYPKILRICMILPHSKSKTFYLDSLIKEVEKPKSFPDREWYQL